MSVDSLCPAFDVTLMVSFHKDKAAGDTEGGLTRLMLD